MFILTLSNGSQFLDSYYRGAISESYMYAHHGENRIVVMSLPLYLGPILLPPRMNDPTFRKKERTKEIRQVIDIQLL